jgi:hypothetical protein
MTFCIVLRVLQATSSKAQMYWYSYVRAAGSFDGQGSNRNAWHRHVWELTAAVRAGEQPMQSGPPRPAPCDRHLDGDVQVGRPPSDPGPLSDHAAGKLQDGGHAPAALPPGTGRSTNVARTSTLSQIYNNPVRSSIGTTYSCCRTCFFIGLKIEP